jgi:hypothetical protein
LPQWSFRPFALSSALLLGGCNFAANSAEREFRNIQDADGSYSQLCAAASRAADEWAKAGDAAKTKEWSGYATVNCYLAESRM